MIRISKLADYGIVLLAQFARDPANPVMTARDLAERTRMPMPTVSKILKALLRGSLLVSQRGAKGGYQLSRPADQISVAEILLAIEGPVALTDCVRSGGECAVERFCQVRSNWQRINGAVRGALEGLKLTDMTAPPLPVRAPAGGPAAAGNRP
jgi:FeS assembly SUF system regulator